MWSPQRPAQSPVMPCCVTVAVTRSTPYPVSAVQPSSASCRQPSGAQESTVHGSASGSHGFSEQSMRQLDVSSLQSEVHPSVPPMKPCDSHVWEYASSEPSHSS